VRRANVPPYVYFAGSGSYVYPPAVRGPNEPGLRAAGLSPDDRQLLRKTIDWLFHEKRALSVKVHDLLSRAGLPPPCGNWPSSASTACRANTAARVS